MKQIMHGAALPVRSVNESFLRAARFRVRPVP